MGHKISPKALRVGYIQDWESRWFSPKQMPDLIEEDFRIRKFLKDRFRMAALSKVEPRMMMRSACGVVRRRTMLTGLGVVVQSARGLGPSRRPNIIMSHVSSASLPHAASSSQL